MCGLEKESGKVSPPDQEEKEGSITDMSQKIGSWGGVAGKGLLGSNAWTGGCVQFGWSGHRAWWGLGVCGSKGFVGFRDMLYVCILCGWCM